MCVSLRTGREVMGSLWLVCEAALASLRRVCPLGLPRVSIQPVGGVRAGPVPVPRRSKLGAGCAIICTCTRYARGSRGRSRSYERPRRTGPLRARRKKSPARRGPRPPPTDRSATLEQIDLASLGLREGFLRLHRADRSLRELRDGRLVGFGQLEVAALRRVGDVLGQARAHELVLRVQHQ